MIQIDIEHFFQMGWNVSKHQLSYIRFGGFFQESFPLSGFRQGTGMLAKKKNTILQQHSFSWQTVHHSDSIMIFRKLPMRLQRKTALERLFLNGNELPLDK